MERNGLEVVDERSVMVDEDVESTFFSGMTADEAQQQMAVRTRKIKLNIETPSEEAPEEATEEAAEEEEAANETEAVPENEGEDADGDPN